MTIDANAKPSAATANYKAPPSRPGRIGRNARFIGAHLGTISQQIAVGVVALGLWELAGHFKLIDTFFVGQPTTMLKAFVTHMTDSVFWGHAASTLIATFWGFAIGSSAGTLSGLILARSKRLATLLMPYITMLNTMPRVALAPLFILWFGVGMNSKIAAAVSLVFFIALINAMAGSRQLDRDLDDLARFLRCSEFTRFVHFVFPVAVPSIFAGLRLGVIYSLLGVVVAEMIAAQTGLGLLITSYTNQFAVSELFSVLLFLMLVSTVLNMIMEKLEKRLLRWQGKE